MINYEEFSKIEIKLGKIKTAEIVEGSDKLVRLEVDFGSETRQIVSGISKYIESAESLIGKTFPFVTNLEPRTIFGLESNGMLVASSNPETGDFAFLEPSKEMEPGSKVV